MRVLLAGGSGFIGTALQRQLLTHGHTVLRLVRGAAAAPGEFEWDPATGRVDPAVIDSADAVVNLSGASLSRIPWTPAYRRTILRSRIDATRTLTEAMGRASSPPEVLLNASAVGFYGDRPGERLDESAGRGDGFLADVVGAWEQASRLAPDGVRVVNLRTGLVLGSGGALAPLRLLTALGAGARLGTGGQHWPWISLHDETAAIVHLLQSPLSGPVNLAGPEPATSDAITRTLARRMRRWYLVRVPAFAIRMLGDAGAELLLSSQKQVPTRLLDDGFVFTHPTADAAIASALGQD